jgi:hypothetical protein
MFTFKMITLSQDLYWNSKQNIPPSKMNLIQALFTLIFNDKPETNFLSDYKKHQTSGQEEAKINSDPAIQGKVNS